MSGKGLREVYLKVTKILSFPIKESYFYKKKKFMQLSEVLFWDSDIKKIDWDKKASYVIAKVAMFGTLKDWNAIKKYYGEKKIKNELLKVRHLDNKTLNFVSLIFNIPKEKFRCYTMRQSIPKHWDY